MVAIFTGFGAGFERGSGAALGSGGLLGSSGLGRGGEGVFLNAATGNLVLQRQDEFLVGRGPDISVARTYNSQGALDDNGDNWRQSTDRRVYGLTGTVNTTGSTVNRVSADGSEITYTWNAGGFYQSTDGAGAHDRLVASNIVGGAVGLWTWTEGSSRITESYGVITGTPTYGLKVGSGSSAIYYIAKQTDLDANNVTFVYAGNNLTRIATANDITGQQSAIEYSWAGTHITSVVTKYTDYTGGTPIEKTLTRTVYEYMQDGTDRLWKVTVDETPANTTDNATTPETLYTTTYAYEGTTKRVTTITQTDGSSLQIKYDASNQVEWLTQTVASGDTRVTKIEYHANQTDVLVYQKQFDPSVDAPATWPNFLQTSIFYDSAKQLTKVVLPPAYTGATAQEINYTYDTMTGDLLTVAGGGATTTYQYDANGNITQITDPNLNVTTRAYNSLNKVTLETRTGAAASGAVVTLYTRYVYDAGNEGHLRYVISHEQRVTEYKYTPEGLLEYTIEYPQHTYTALAAPTLPTEANMDAWRNGLADRSTAKITKFVYDARGNLFDKYNYGAASSAGVENTSDGDRHDHFVYDQAGQLLSRYTETQQTETFLYDGLGRLTASTDLSGGSTTILFEDAATKTTVTTASGFTSVSSYNKAGELVSRVDLGADTYTANSTTPDAPTIQHQYDKNGRVRVTTLAAARDGTLRNDKTYFLYDKAGKKIAEIGAGGQLIEYRYDEATGRLVATVHYNNVLTTTQIAKLADPNSELEFISSGTETANQLLRPTAHSYDIWQWTIYDSGGRVAATIMGDGSVTTYAYDKSDRLVAATSYYNKVAVSAYRAIPTPTTLVIAPTADAARDRVTRTFYDGDGRVIGALNGEGFLTETIYDSAGQKVQDIAYATATVQANRASGSFATLKTGLASANDISMRYVYDGQGLLRFTIDALNRVSELIYWEGAGSEAYASGLVRKTIAYVAALGSLADYKYATVKTALAAVPATYANNANNRTTYAVYNDRAQLVYTVDPLGAATGFAYDNLGRVTKTTQFAVTTSVTGAASTWKGILDAWAGNSSNIVGARIARNYYAARGGDLLFTIDAEGYVTGYVYEAQGRLYQTSRYPNKLTPTDAWTTANVTAASKGTPVTTLYRYDTLGRLVNVYDGNNTVRYMGYHNNGKQAWDILAYTQGMDESRALKIYDQAGKLVIERRFTSEVGNAYGLGASATQVNQAQKITSANGQYSAMVTREGELRIYHKGEQIWSNGVREVVSGATYRLVAQTNGNLVIFRDVSGQAAVTIWQSNTAGSYSGAAYLVMQNDGNLVFAKNTAPASQDILWSSATAGKVAQDPNAAEYFDTNFTYDGLGNLLTKTEPNGSVTTYAYDKVGRVLTETVSPDGVVNYVTTYEYDAFGRAVRTRDRRGNDSFFFFDKLDRVTQSVDTEHYVTAASYTAFGEIASTTRYLSKPSNESSINVSTPPTIAAGDTGSVTTFTYDKLGRVLTKTDAMGSVTQFQYDSLGQLVKTIDALGGQSFVYYDALGRVRYTVDAENYVTETISDSANAITRKRYATKLAGPPTSTPPSPVANSMLDQITSYTYDGVGRVLTQTDGLNGVTTFKYDRRGNLVKTIDALNNASYFYYDKLDRVVLAIDAEGYATGTSYKPTGEVASRTRYAAKATNIGDLGKAPTLTLDAAKDSATSYIYDRLGRVTSETNGEGVVTTYGYDANGNVTGKNEAGLRTSAYEYDKLGRLTKTIHDPLFAVATATTAYPASASVQAEELKYDALGNVIEKKDAAGAKTLFWYDKLGHLTHEVSASGTLSVHTYDANGNRTQTQIYAALLSPVPTTATTTAPTQTGASRITIYGYDELNRVTQVQTQGARSATYDGTVLAVDAGTVTLTQAYQYDALGNVVLATDSKGAKTYSYYDRLGRKTAQVDAELYRTDWVYNATGNVTKETRYANRLVGTPAIDTLPAYTANAADDRVTDFTYDNMGRRRTEVRLNVLVHNGSGANVSQSATITYTYNGLGAVTSKTEASGDTIGYDYDRAGRLIREKREANGQSYAYTDLNGVNVTPTVDYTYNGLGDLTQVRARGGNGSTTGASDERITLYSYDAGGRLLTKTDASGFVRTYRYDLAGRVTREEYTRLQPDGSSLTEAVGYDYDAEGHVIRQGVLANVAGAWSRDGAGIDTVAMAYNAFGEVSQRGFVHFAAGTATTLYGEQFEYDDAGRLTRTNAGDGVWKYFMYDKAGNQTLMITSTGADLNAAATDTLTEVLALWANAAAIATTNVTGVVATITRYDGRNQAIEVREPQRRLTAAGALTDLKTSRVYNAFGEVIQEANANAHDVSGAIIATASIQYAYNTMGRLIQTTSPAVSVTSEAGVVTANVRPTEKRYYDGAGRLVASRDANDNLTKLTLLAGTGYGGTEALVTEAFGADNSVVRTKYDIHGDARRIESQLYNATTAPQFVTLQTFDAMGRLIQVDHAGGLKDYYRYDGLGQRIKHANNFYNSPVSGNAYYNAAFNAANMATWNNAESTGYDLQGRMAQVVAMGGDTTTYAYAWDGGLGGIGVSGGWRQTTTYANGRALLEDNDVFGRLVSKTDLGGNVSGFVYDAAGRLTQRTGGLTLTQTYFNTGRLATTQFTITSISPKGGWGFGAETQTNIDNRVTSFGYDKLGAIVSENLTHSGEQWTWIDPPQIPGEPEPGYWDQLIFNRVYKNATVAYDALGRIASWTEAGGATPAASHVFQYDANGNIRRSLGTYRALDAQGNASSATTTQDYWYRYDAMNRMTTAKGALSAGQIVRGTTGVDLVYRLDGSRAYTINAQNRREDYAYDAAGRVIEVRGGANLSAPGIVLGTFGYDAMGRQTSEVDVNAGNGQVNYTRTASYNSKGQLVSDDVSAWRYDDVYRTLSTYSYGTGANYALGQVTQVDAQNWKDGAVWPTTRTINSYVWRDGAIQGSIQYDGDINNPNNALWNTSYEYDIVGGQAQLSKVQIADGRPRTVSFVNDFLGQGIKRDEADALSGGDPHEIWYRFSGRQQAYVGNNGTIDVSFTDSVPQKDGQVAPSGSYADFDLAYNPINAYEQGSRGGMYTVQAGDTLQGIAASLWGDANLWYKIAEINGLTAESALVEGQPLIIPVGVQTNANTAATFKPYDPLEVLGATSPTSPKPQKAKCGGMGQILLAVIAVVVTIWTAGATFELFSGATLGAAVEGGALALSTLGGSLAGAGLGGAAAFAVGGAVGSIVSQGIGVMTGIQDKFSWNAVGLAAIGSALGAAGNLGVGGRDWGSLAARAMVRSALTQGIGVATGLQKDFSWAGVAAAGVGVALRANFNVSSPFDVVNSGAQLIADAATRTLIEGSDFGDNIMAALPNVIGQTIGEAIAGGMAGRGASRTGAPNSESTQQPASEVEAESIEPSPLIDLPALSLPRFERVGKNGSFWRIAERELGAGATNAEIKARTLELMAANPTLDPMALRADQYVIVPGGPVEVTAQDRARYGAAHAQYQQNLAERVVAASANHPVSMADFEDHNWAAGMRAMSTERWNTLSLEAQVVQAAAMLTATEAITAMLLHPGTSPEARANLHSFMSGRGQRSYSYRYDAESLDDLFANVELFNSGPRHYFREQVNGLIESAVADNNLEFLEDGLSYRNPGSRDFGFRPEEEWPTVAGRRVPVPDLRDGVSLGGGAHLGDIIGTMTYGWTLSVRDGTMHISASNATTLESFAGGNIMREMGGPTVPNPPAGPFSQVTQQFYFTAPVPERLRPPRQGN